MIMRVLVLPFRKTHTSMRKDAAYLEKPTIHLYVFGLTF